MDDTSCYKSRAHYSGMRDLGETDSTQAFGRRDHQSSALRIRRTAGLKKSGETGIRTAKITHGNSLKVLWLIHATAL